jgi:DNA polymerase-3 subunit beta
MEGETVVTGKMFGDFIKKLEGEQVELSKLDGNDLTIRSADSDSRMQVFSAEEFPKINKDINENYFEIKQADFKSIVDKTVFACATDESRPILKGKIRESNIFSNIINKLVFDYFCNLKLKVKA